MMGRRRRGDASHDRRPNAWSLVGLTLALIGPGAVALLSDQPAGTSFTLATSLPLLALFATLAAAVVAIAVVGESLRWRDVGFGHVSWRSLVSAVGLALVLILAVGPVVAWMVTEIGGGGFAGGEARLAALPVWYVCLTIVVVAGGEEWLYRGYALERLEALTGNRWLAAVISLLAFAAAHIPMWGIGPALTTLVSGGVMTAFYLWRRDILALILAHVATDLYGLVIAR